MGVLAIILGAAVLAGLAAMILKARALDASDDCFLDRQPGQHSAEQRGEGEGVVNLHGSEV